MEIKDRIKVIIEREGLTQVAFAEVTGIKPAALSHVLTGRNNASREVIDRILEAFPKYEEDWLVLGQGAVLTEEAKNKLREEQSNPLFPQYKEQSRAERTEVAAPASVSRGDREHASSGATTPLPAPSPARKIAKIIVYYTDNTFETLLPSD